MDDQIAALVAGYYTNYYRDQLGLPDWEARVANRLSESAQALAVVEQVARWTNLNLGDGLKVLVVGAGTGAEFMALASRGCEVYGVEPESAAVQIGGLKAGQARLPAGRFMAGRAEHLPFPDSQFDVVWCWSVIEHVQNVPASLAEMVRVAKPWGHVFIQTPDYRHVYEPHYKLMLPMWAPRWFVKGLLGALGRPTQFLDTLQLVNSRQLTNLLQDHPVVAFQVIQSWPAGWRPNARRTWLQIVTYWIVRTFAIQRDQYWIVRKLDQPR